MRAEIYLVITNAQDSYHEIERLWSACQTYFHDLVDSSILPMNT